MLSSLFSGISGLMTNGQAINVIGNNIANVNTIGFKASRATFQDALYQSIQSAAGTSQVGRGANLSSVDTLFSQGSFETTSEATDLAIGGKGFFIVKSEDGTSSYYTRAGQFRFDKDGNLANPAGYILQGKAIDRVTNYPTGVDTNIIVSAEPSLPKSSEVIGMAANLQSNAAWKGEVTQPAASSTITQVQVNENKWARAGSYTATTAQRLAAAITHTGTGAVEGPLTGTLKINGTDIVLASVDAADLATKINTALTAAGAKVTASLAGGKLVLTATANGTDMSIDDSAVTTGRVGWSAEDKTSTDLNGATMSLTVNQMLNDNSQGTTTYTNYIAAAGTSAATNFKDLTGQESGLDITYSPITSTTPVSQTFAVSGFNPTTTSTLSNPSTTSNYSSSVTVYDSLGQPHVVNVYFRKSHETQTPTQTAVWEWHAQLNASDSSTQADIDVQAGYLTFNNSGTLISGGDPVEVTFNFSSGAPNQKISLVFGSGSGGGTTTQYPIASTTNFQTQDGYPPGVLQNVSVSTAGVISGHYSNGQILDLYQLTLANFNNPQGLTKQGGNLFSETIESGVAYTKAPGEGGLGSINSNSLEQSNVDLATEFVKMITSQRGFQANSRVITTTDEILQELMQLKR
jgi:flagellar hook protein FlgE